MARDVERVWADGGLAIVALGPVTVTYLREPTTLVRMKAVRDHLTGHTERWSAGAFALTVLGVEAVGRTPEPGVREASAAVARDFKPLGSVIVVEGDGFASAATRALLTGIFLVARARSKIVSTSAAAAEWLAPQVSKAYPPEMTVAELLAAVDAARASLRPR